MIRFKIFEIKKNIISALEKISKYERNPESKVSIKDVEEINKIFDNCESLCSDAAEMIREYISESNYKKSMQHYEDELKSIEDEIKSIEILESIKNKMEVKA